MLPEILIVEVEEQEPHDATPEHRASISRDFLFGGRAVFRVTNPSGNTMDFRIGARMGRQGTQWNGEVSYFASVFTTEFGFTYIGVVDPETGDVKPTGQSKLLPGTKEHTVVEWAIKSAINNSPIKPGYQITHTGKCGKCGKTLISSGDRDSGFHLDCIP
jgi:hypothetical protein